MLVRHHVPVRAAGEFVAVGRGHARRAGRMRVRPTRWARAIASGATRCGSRGRPRDDGLSCTLVLAKDSRGRTAKLVPGVKGISLFIVPKEAGGHQGHLTGERNDVALAGLNHKAGLARAPPTRC